MKSLTTQELDQERRTTKQEDSYQSGQETREEEEDTQAWWGLLKLLILCHTSENKEVISSRVKDGKRPREGSFD